MPKLPFTWKCLYCGHAQVVSDETYDRQVFRIYNDLSEHGRIAGLVISIVCSNSDCKKITLEFSFHKGAYSNGNWHLVGGALYSWSLLPESSAKPQPGYIPKPIIENYNQACRIRDLSPECLGHNVETLPSRHDPRLLQNL